MSSKKISGNGSIHLHAILFFQGMKEQDTPILFPEGGINLKSDLDKTNLIHEYITQIPNRILVNQIQHWIRKYSMSWPSLIYFRNGRVF